MNTAIIFGAKSYEHEISIISAITIKKVFSSDLKFIFIDKHENFYLIPSNKLKSTLFSNGDYKKCDQLYLMQGSFFSLSFFGKKKIEFDFAINLIHGATGEDGTISSILDFYNIPYIGPRLVASVVSFDKDLTKKYALSCGVDTLNSATYTKNDEIKINDFPIIIKPATLGSSLGIAIVKDADQLDYALDVAFEYDNKIIVEPYIKGIKEYNLAGTKIDGKFIFSIVEEPQKDDFLDFDKKYLDFNRTSQVSKANISKDLEQQLKDNFSKIYNDTFDGSLIRCDFFVQNDKVFLNEINPIPGSMAHYLFDDFISIIKDLSLNLPIRRDIQIDYSYVNKIKSAKGKV